MTAPSEATTEPLVAPEVGLRALDEIEAAYRTLTAPGAEFALTPRTVDGRRVEAFDGVPETLGELFNTIRHSDDLGMYVYGSDRWDYAALRAKVAGFARYLRVECAVGPDDRVAVAMRNYPEWAVAFWAAQIRGAVIVPLNAWSNGRELETLISDAAPAVLIADGERLDRLAGWLADHSGVRAVGVRCIGERPGIVDLAAVATGGTDADLVPSPRRPEDPATILYTSGTTGRPIGAIGSHLNHITALRSLQLRTAARELIAGPSGPVTGLLTYPFFHISGIAVLTSSLILGKQVVLMYRWDVDAAMHLIDEFGIAEVYSPPTVTRDLTATAHGRGRSLPSLRSVGGGGAASSVALIADVRDAFDGRVGTSTAYGLTETTGAIANIGGAGLLAFPASVGRPLPGVEIRIVDEHGDPVRSGDAGELHVYGALVSAGYAGQPEATADSFRDGWFRTGDLAYVDDHGLVYLVGRLKDVIIRGGENIYPVEIEDALEQHPDVVEAAVFGRPHPLMGEEVSAIVRLVPDARVTIEQLREHAARMLARHKVPTVIELSVDPLPRTATGKLQKHGLRVPPAVHRPDTNEIR